MARAILAGVSSALLVFGCTEPPPAPPVFSLDPSCDPETAIEPCEPDPPPPSSLMLGVYYFSGWTVDPGFYRPTQRLFDDVFRWNDEHPTDGYREPHGWHGGWQGWDFDNAYQHVVDQHILGMYDAKFHFVVFQTGWTGGIDSDKRNWPFWTHAISRYQASAYKSLLRFALSWDDEYNNPGNGTWHWRKCNGWTAADYATYVAAMFTYWRDNLMGDPQYLRIDGELPLFFWEPTNLLTPYHTFSETTECAPPGGATYTVAADTVPSSHPGAIIGMLRELIPSVYPVAIVKADSAFVDSAAAWGFSAITGSVYQDQTMTTPSYTNLRTRYETVWWPNMAARASRRMLPYFPVTTPGFDGRPWNESHIAHSTPDEYEAHIRFARDWVVSRPATTNNIVMTCCWNEWAEGIFLERASGISYQTGTAHADAHRRVYTGVPSGQRRPPRGWIDGVFNQHVLEGWAIDDDAPSQLVEIHFYLNAPWPNGIHLGGTGTEHPRGDVNSAFGVIGNHGWKFAIPAAYRDGQPHPIYVYAMDTSGETVQSVTIGPAPYYFTAYP